MRSFLLDESGAITVDWTIVVTAAVATTALVAGAVGVTTRAGTAELEADFTTWRTGVTGEAGYAPARPAAFAAMVTAMSALERDDLDTVAAFVNARTYAGDRTDRLRDLRAAVDATYVAVHEGTRTHVIEFDEAELARIYRDHGFGDLLAPY